jgi:magnesium chelatase family protein
MLTKTNTGTVRGVEGLLVKVEVDHLRGIQAFRVVGLPDAAVREAEVRVRSALKNTGFELPDGRITVNLAPAGVKKQGAGFDLAVALGIAAHCVELPADRLEETVFLGELALDGSVRAVRGVLAVAVEAARQGVTRIVVPRANGSEAAIVKAISAFAVDSLREAIDVALGDVSVSALVPKLQAGSDRAGADLRNVKGQRQAKRALEIAAAGGHNLLLVGPPGAGKSLLASTLPSILPPLSFQESLEVTRIHSVAGLLDEGALLTSAPFRAPHHTISPVAMVGGGAGPTPGEVSLAHRGVLFLDELAEFPRSALESLRQPLEEGRVRIRRVDCMARLPARFTLVAATNPCPCGFRGTEARPCECTPGMVHRYEAKMSGPLMDRIDLRVPVRPVRSDDLLRLPAGDTSQVVRDRVNAARRVQAQRFRRRRVSRLNAFMLPGSIERYCQLSSEGREVLREAVDRLGLSARGFHRVLKVSRTIADLAGEPAVLPLHLQEAIHYRTSFDRSP